MRRVHVIDGIKERVNEILGTDTANETPSGTPEITGWSIQAAMLENIRRVVAALVGDADFGRPIRGLSLGFSGGAFTVSEGYGITKRGDVIWLRSGAIIPLSGGGQYVKHHLYIKYSEKLIDGTLYPDEGRKTSVIGEPGSYDIVYDGKATYRTPGDTADLFTQVVSELGMSPGDPGAENYVYLGYYNATGAILRPNGRRGLTDYPSNEIDANMVNTDNLNVSIQALIKVLQISAGTLMLSDGSILKPSPTTTGVGTSTDEKTYTITADGVPKVFKFVNGVLVSVTP